MLEKEKNSDAKHDLNGSTTTTEKVLTCEICYATFTQGYYLKKHIESIHGGIKPFKCSTCYKIFSHKYNLKSHIATVHNKEKPFNCDYCDKTFPDNTLNRKKHNEGSFHQMMKNNYYAQFKGIHF